MGCGLESDLGRLHRFSSEALGRSGIVFMIPSNCLTSGFVVYRKLHKTWTFDT